MIYRTSRVKNVSLYPVLSSCISFSLFLSCTLPLRATNDPRTYPLQKSGVLALTDSNSDFSFSLQLSTLDKKLDQLVYVPATISSCRILET